MHGNTSQHITAYRNILQHTAAHCNTLQHMHHTEILVTESQKSHVRLCTYEVATVSRIDSIMGLFCRILSLLQGSFAKETYDFIDPTARSHPIYVYVYKTRCIQGWSVQKAHWNSVDSAAWRFVRSSTRYVLFCIRLVLYTSFFVYVFFCMRVVPRGFLCAPARYTICFVYVYIYVHIHAYTCA